MVSLLTLGKILLFLVSSIQGSNGSWHNCSPPLSRGLHLLRSLCYSWKFCAKIDPCSFRCMLMCEPSATTLDITTHRTWHGPTLHEHWVGHQMNLFGLEFFLLVVLY